MKVLHGVALLSLALLGACSTPEQGAGGPQVARVLPEVPTGFDGVSNDAATGAEHQADQTTFDQVETLATGLGPLYNAQSCRECHQSPVSGGVSQVLELRVGHTAPNGSFQNPEIPINDGATVIKGRSLVNARAICPNGAFPNTDIQEHVPATENVRALRASLNLLGDGYVEAVADSTLQGIAKKQCSSTGGKICGVALTVPVLESPGATRVGRFGWKDQHASLLSFAGDAYVNEMGVTNALFPDEVTALCNTASEPNDKPGADGLADIDHFARFIRATKAPSRDARLAATAEAHVGELLFAKLGCEMCHVSTLTTAPPGTPINGGKLMVSAAIGNKTFHPYSDFLLHDVGTGDGIVMSAQEHYGRGMSAQKLPAEALQATANRLRTTPLWGLHTHATLMHDGASVNVHDAIVRHRGEAAEASRQYQRLSREDQAALAAFLDSL